MGRLRGCLWLTTGLIVAILAGFVGFMTLSRASAQNTPQAAAAPVRPVVVAARAVAVRGVLTAEDLALKEVPVDAVPEGALQEIGEATGKVSLVELYPGETVLRQRLVDPNVTAADGRKALALNEEDVLVAFPAADLMSKAGVLEPGDHVDLLFSLAFPADRGVPGGAGAGSGNDDELTAFNLLQNVTISAMVAGPTPAREGAAQAAPEGLLLALSPQDALVLKYMKDAGGTLDVVLRAPGAEQPFEAEPVDVDYMINRYQIPTAAGR